MPIKSGMQRRGVGSGRFDYPVRRGCKGWERRRSGDWIVEQAVHNWDVLNWAVNAQPVRAMPSCQALVPAEVAAFAWLSLRFTIAAGGSSCAISQRLIAVIAAVPLIAIPHRLIRPPAATRPKPTTSALELAEPI